MHQSKQPDPLIQARQLFRKQQYEQSKAKLQSIKHSNENIELNLFLTEHNINPGNSDIVLNALMNRLTEINIRLYKENMGVIARTKNKNKNPIKYISHEFYYWNIIVIAQQIGKPSIASLMGNEALHFSSSFRSKTALMIIYQMLKQMACENRLASCGTLVMKFKEIFDRAKQFNKDEELYRIMNHVMWTKIFLRLGFLDQSLEMYKQKLNRPQQQQLFESFSKTLPFKIYRQFLYAEIQYFKQNYKTALQILGEILSNVQKNDKIQKQAREKIINMIESNVAAIFMSMDKATIGRKLTIKTNQYFRKVCHQGIDNERFLVYERSKELLFYSFLKAPESQLTREDYLRAFHLMSRTESNKSYKLFYRKAQMCVQYLHHLIRSSQNTLPYTEIADSFDCSYFYINDPYFQSKGKNKNPVFNHGKRYYRRYVVEEWDDKGCEERKLVHRMDQSEQGHPLHVKLNEPANIQPQEMVGNEAKSSNRSQQIIEQKPQKKKRKGSNIVNHQTTKDKKTPIQQQGQNKKRMKSEPKQKQLQTKPQHYQLGELSFQAITFFKQSLSLLEEENKVILTFRTSETNDLTERVNLKIYEDYRVFKQSILMNLCYMYLVRYNWAKVIQHAQMYRQFVAYDKEANSFENHNIKKAYNHQEYFCVLSYELQAYSQINKFNKAYETMNDIIQLGYAETVGFQASSSINANPEQCFIEETNQYHNLLYNITVLHMRDNHLAEAHQALQKILTETNILPNRSSFKTPLSVNDLLLHYHLRTGDRISALQILKRRRVMGMGGVNGVYNVLKVTK